MVVVSKKVKTKAKVSKGGSKKETAGETKSTKPKDVKVKTSTKTKSTATKSTSKTSKPKTAVAKTAKSKAVKSTTKALPREEKPKVALPKVAPKPIQKKEVDTDANVSKHSKAEHSRQYQIEDLFSKLDEYKKISDEKACSVDKKIDIVDSSIKQILSKLSDIDKRLLKQEFGFFGCCVTT